MGAEVKPYSPNTDARAAERNSSLKGDGARWDPAHYPLGYRQRVLWSDLDVQRHVNNGAIGRLFEEGRAQTNELIFGHVVDPVERPVLALVRVTIEFLAEGRYPGDIEIRTGIARLGNSSLHYRQAAFQDGRCIALAEAVMVKNVDGHPANLSPTERNSASRPDMRPVIETPPNGNEE
jgi:acyl-CoA thioester hydrolase